MKNLKEQGGSVEKKKERNDNNKKHLLHDPHHQLTQNTQIFVYCRHIQP